MKRADFLIILRQLAIVVVSPMFAACGSTPSTQPAPIETQTQPADSAPLVMTSTSLPAGFPPPGPVDHVIVKQYPAYRLARIERFLRPDGVADAQGMFMALVKHVERNDIAATSPVEATYEPPAEPAGAEFSKKSRPVAMSFIYPDPTIGTIGKDPTDPRISIVDLPASMYLSVGIRGSYSSQNFNAAYARLITSLAQSPGEYTVAGPPRYLFYNSPLVPAFASFGEVQLPIAKLPAPTTAP